HLQQPPAPVRHGVRLYHAGRVDHREARVWLSADDESAARSLRAHHPDSHRHRFAGLRNRSHVVLVRARVVPLSPGRGLTVECPCVVEFRAVTKRFGDVTVIRDVTFAVEDKPARGEFVTILGPSGCGKSTVLRLIAGLPPHHPPTDGSVLVMEQAVGSPGADRGMVFQDYTSFDNRTVEDNVAFGLECRGVAAAERRGRGRGWGGQSGRGVERESLKYPTLEAE